MPDGTVDQFEQRVAEDRDALATSLETLSAAVDPDRMKAEAARTAEIYGREALNYARENAAAAALLGLGATLLVSGIGRREQRDAQLRAASAAAGTGPGLHARARASAASHGRATAHRMRETLEKGLDRLPPSARRRVMDARLAALRAQEQVERHAGKVTRRGTEYTRTHPVESGALAFGLGVLAAALIPETHREDEWMGSRRDRLVDAVRDSLARELHDLRASAERAEREAAKAAPRVPS